MNRIYVFKLFFLSLVLMFGIGTISCGSDDDDNNESPENPEKNPNVNPETKDNMDNLIKEIRVSGSIFHLYYFAYDYDGNLQYFTDKGITKGPAWTIKEKDSNNAILSYFLGGTYGSMEYKFDLNKMGYCTKGEFIKSAIYDNDGYLSEINESTDSQSDVESYKYQNGDILSCNRIIRSVNISSTQSITYKMSTELNDANIDINQLIYGDNDSDHYLKIFGILGKRSKHIFSNKHYYKHEYRYLGEKESEYDVVVTDITRDSHNRIGQISYTLTANNTIYPYVATFSYVYTTK